MILLLSLTGLSGNKNNNALADKAQAIADTIVSDYGSVSVQYAIIDKGSIISEAHRRKGGKSRKEGGCRKRGANGVGRHRVIRTDGNVLQVLT